MSKAELEIARDDAIESATKCLREMWKNASCDESMRVALEIIKMDSQTANKKPQTVAADVVEVAEKIRGFYMARWRE